ncbi:MAG: transglycosylase domain-containing protein, partial [Mucilaginibacter polytrichastri]|nr:transglycosylase domain-containing protein [Mucilaginibacter polytrichastri]
MKDSTKKLSQDKIRRYNGYIWKTVVAGIFIAAGILLAVSFGLFGELPSFRDLENPKSNLASEVISSDDVVLGTYFIQNRSPVNYNQISPNVINALIATEDTRFYEHSGIDFQRTFSIIFYNLIGKKQGASTITQQLALNLFSERSRNPFKRIVQKLQEWVIAVKLERNYTKQEIITMYLNTVDFGSYNTFGIKSAARTYFNVAPDKLSPEQAAVLVGMLKGPSLYSPVRNPERALNRRNVVLGRMQDEGFLTAGQASEMKAKPMKLDLHPTDHNQGLATYFRMVLRKEVQNLIKEQSFVKADGELFDIDRDGLK